MSDPNIVFQDLSDMEVGPQIVPQSPELEEAVIGALLVAPVHIREVRAILEADDFYIHRYRWAYTVLLELHDKKQDIDLITFEESLKAHKQLDEFGGRPEILRLMSLQEMNAYHVVSYATTVQEFAVRRRMLEAANELSKQAYSTGENLDKCLFDATRGFDSIFERVAVVDDAVDMSEAMSGHMDHMNDVIAGDDKYVETPWLALNQFLAGGLRAPDMFVVAGRPGQGKTSALLQLSKYCAQYLHNVGNPDNEVSLYFSVEMPTGQLIARQIAQEGIDTQHVTTGRFADNEIPVYQHVIENFPLLPQRLIYMPLMTPEKIRAFCAKISYRYKIALIAVDYFQKMSTPGFERRNRVEELSYISGQLKLFASEFDAPLAVGAQLSRAIEYRDDRKPILSDLKDCGALEQDADEVLFVEQPEKYKKSKRNMGKSLFYLGKQRNGPTGEFSLKFEKAFTRFVNYKNVSNQADDNLQKNLNMI